MSLVGRKSATVVGAFFLLGVLFLVSSFLTIDYMVDYWWFDSLGYAFYFLQRQLYRYLVFLGVTALFSSSSFSTSGSHRGIWAPAAPPRRIRRRNQESPTGIFCRGSALDP